MIARVPNIALVGLVATVLGIGAPARAAPQEDAQVQGAAARATVDAAAATEALIGRPIVSLDVQAPPSESPYALAQLIDIRPGYVLARQQVREAIERLYALGRFAQVQARVAADAGSVRLQFIITPLLRLDSLKLRGFRRVPKDALIAALRLSPGEEVDRGTPALLQSRAKRYLAQQGYPHAQIDVSVLPGERPDGRRIELRGREGTPDRISQVIVCSRGQVPKRVLRAALRVRVGAVANADAIQADRDALMQLVQEHGFLRAHVAPPQVRATDGGVEVTFHIEAHERLAFHSVGNHALGDRALVRLWPTSLGGAPEQMLGLYRQRLLTAYNAAGYPNARVHVRLGSHVPRRAHSLRPRRPPGGARRLDVHVREGQPVWIEHVLFSGAHALPADILKAQVRGLLQDELAPEGFFGPLGPGDWVQRGAPQTPEPRVAHHVPPGKRWVTAVYQQAADDIAAAYRDLGFLDAVVTPPLAPQRVPQASAPAAPSAESPARATSDEEPLFADDTPLGGLPPGRMAHVRPPDVAWATATFEVNEGSQRFIDHIRFSGNLAVDAQQLLVAIAEAAQAHPLMAPIAPGAPLSYAGIEDGRIAIVRKFRDQGYLYARVFAHVDLPPTSAFAQVHYAVEEGPAVRVQRLLVRGNAHTREGVIRSRITLAPGKLYRLGQAIDDQREIMQLGTFAAVRVRLVDEEHQGEQKDVVAEVEESPRQLIEVVPGLSTAQGMRLKTSYAHLNVLGTATMFVASAKVNRQVFFDLYGSYADQLRTRYGAYRGAQQLTRAIEREVRLGLRSPPIKFVRGDPQLRLDVVDQRVNAVRYGLDATTATFGVDMTPTRRLKVSAEVQAGVTQLECPLGNDCDQDLDVRRLRGGRPIQQGTLHSIKFGPTLHFEGRDSPISPSRGFYAFARVAQAFGSARSAATQSVDTPFAFIKWEGIASTYVSMWGQVLAFSARAGSIGIERSLVPVDERFFLGGRDTLRGFVETTLIPQDACVVQDPTAPLPSHCAEGIAASPAPPLSLGGNTYLLLKSELRVPLRDGLSLDVFADVGNLWVDLARAQRFALRVGTGAGLRYATPVGAITVDLGLNTAPRAINDESAWTVHFSIGSF